MPEKLKTIRGVNLANKRVIFRVAYDFTLRQRGQGYIVPDDWRIRATLPTLHYLLKRRAKVIILTWLGRPNHKEKKFQLDPVARRLSVLIRRPVKKINVTVGPEAEAAVNSLQAGEIVMLENIRFYQGEQKADPALARKLARLGDVVVNDAFAQVHRLAASLAPLQKLLPSYAGFLLQREMAELGALFNRPPKPRLAIIGGVKVSTRLELIARLRRDFDHILLGGALANTIFKAQGQGVGRSMIEREMIAMIQSKAFLKNHKIIIPVDVVVRDGAKARQRAVDRVGTNEIIADIGPDTQALYARYIAQARTIVWSGPMGQCEQAPFDQGTNAVARAIAKSSGRSIIGGGDTITAVRRLKIEKRFDFISTGGGAMLYYLESKSLPGLQYLKRQQ